MDAEGAIRVLVVDDHPVIHRGLELVIGEAAGLRLCGSAYDGQAGVQLAQETSPDVCLLDIRMPGMDGIATAAKLRDTAILMYTAHGDRRLMSDAIEAGATGYVLKSSPVEDLVRAIHSVAGGRPWMDPTLSPVLLAEAGDRERVIGEREREVLRLLAAGMRMQDVADQLGLTREQVKSDARRAAESLEANGRVHAVATALRRDLIE